MNPIPLSFVQPSAKLLVSTNVHSVTYPLDRSARDDDNVKQQQQQQQQCCQLYPRRHLGRLFVRFADRLVDASSDCPSPSPIDLIETEQDMSSLWYSIKELHTMKDEVRTICDTIRSKEEEKEQHQEMNNENDAILLAPKWEDNRMEFQTTNHDTIGITTPTVDNNALKYYDDKVKYCRKKPLLAIDSNTRGLEPRICLERQRRRYVANRYILRLASQVLSTKQQQHCSNTYNNDDTNNPMGKMTTKNGLETLAQASRNATRWATQLAIKEASRDYIRAYGYDKVSDLYKIRFMNQYYHRHNNDHRDAIICHHLASENSSRTNLKRCYSSVNNNDNNDAALGLNGSMMNKSSSSSSSSSITNDETYRNESKRTLRCQQ
jgi:hypothetical protein